MPLNIPILLTWLRVAMIPLVVGVFYLPDGMMPPHVKNLTAAIFFIIAAATDWLDGFLARRWNQTSSFGAFLDPVADKLMVTAALLSLLALDRVTDLIALIIIGREITISALREWMAQIGASKSVAVNFLGKLKTTVQMIAIPLLLYHDYLYGVDAALLGGWLIYVAAVLTLWSMFYYMKLAWPQIRERSGIAARAPAQK
ncbi:CDP-diacylglycerol--glycerol-3-phosphate 3-phosphatidyltransferase/cardiolipin synthase [Cupriavidus gilardii J11]|uniref:CDP-diacylglycerol--glycerol-3-phosphate 3-phosphatidyltransferase n=1 Tax=Cupriavidus gilardii J11 TaxID=936133 RepID=A0A562BK32_9BURK|nr:CDP-diacylglycerol--glycerol-3-phosphate 3-phosphatidyltransferase [Cupriavidus gilardii]TWG85451.1 CDP-diacylglycerol--glycerol-3-phosphate 3-phosphatidyltransferase/cardiolipin synthase [Cupriavidus gilardii J11]